MSGMETGWNIIQNIFFALRKGLMTVLVLLIRGYQIFISPYFPMSCRYHPTCSSYALDAVKIHGPLKGALLAAWRVLRCNPWTNGGEDPVPERKADGTGHHRHGGDAKHYKNAGHHCLENSIQTNMNRHHF